MASLTSRPHRILALYKFVSPKLEQSSLKSLQENLESFCLSQNVLGTLILSTEGINGTICYPSSDKDEVLTMLQANFPGLRTRLSWDSRCVFPRLRIKIKSQIVTLGNIDVDPTAAVGEYIKPGEEWDRLLNDPDCVVVDARNDYEVKLGTFAGAVNPHTNNFNEFPEWLANSEALMSSKKIAMFCTGGIRCEKASSLAKKLFPDKPVYHLEGGILAYLDHVPEAQSTFQGECYVFDKRVAVTHGLRPSEYYVACFACRQPLSPEDREESTYKEGISCKYCVDAATDKQKQRFEDRNRQIELAARQGKLHIRDSKYCSY